jgi:small subunit ribosomal protein S16
VAVRIRLKKMGRRHRPFYRICVMDSRSARSGKVIEEVGTYDPLVREMEKQCSMRTARIDYWLSVGAKPTENVQRLIDRYKGKVPEVRIDQPKVRSVPDAAPMKSRRKREKPAEPELESPAEPEPQATTSQETAAE